MQCHYASDQALLVSLGETVSLETHRRVRKLLRILQDAPLTEPGLEGVRNLHPAYNSLMIKFDPCVTTHARLEVWLQSQLDRLGGIDLPPPRLVEIPVRYGGDDGPDLESVAQLHGMRPADVIELHSGATYTVYFLGFVPGFAYLGGLPAALATPRLPSPRKRVEAGSLGIAGEQTGVYPIATPGGWRLIGKTPLQIFQAEREQMSLLELGDLVRFRPL